MSLALQNRVTLVTGAGSGIGRAIAQAFARSGAAVYLVGRTQHTLEETVQSVRDVSATAKACVSDLTVDSQLEGLAALIQSEAGRLDILVHSAGAIACGSMASQPTSDFDRQYQANVRAPYRLTQLLLPQIQSCSGQVVFINSSVGLRAPGGSGQFSATQHALKAVADSLREEVNASGIRVLSIYPGRTATPRQASLYKLSKQEYQPGLLLQPEDIASMVLAAVTLPPTAEVTDIHIRPLIKSYS